MASRVVFTRRKVLDDLRFFKRTPASWLQRDLFPLKNLGIRPTGGLHIVNDVVN